jgi:DNA-directed RNA polymerase specialized sigma24 family protein
LEIQEVLTNEEQYRGITKRLPQLTRQQELTVIERARTGDPAAREELIISCLNYVGGLANRYKQYLYHDEYLDLVGEGNLAVVTAYDTAILRENPCGYLRAVVKYTIIRYCATRASLIVRPEHTTEAIYMRSLDEKPYTYDTLGLHAPPVVSEPTDYTFLYQALAKLPRSYRDVLKKQFGLYDSTPVSLYALSRRKKKADRKGTALYNTKYRALKRLRILLAKQEERILAQLGTQKKASALS